MVTFIYSFVTFLAVGAIALGVFPRCYIDDVGPAFFARATDILVFLLGSIAFVAARKRHLFGSKVSMQYVTGSLIFMIGSRLCFFLYGDVYGLFSAFGHIFKVIPFGFFWQMVIEEGLDKPYESLFRQVYQRSIRDPLTGLLNREGMKEMAQAIFAATKGRASSFVIIIMDLDNFKSVNDLYGHAEGDLALKEFAQLLTNVFRESDILVRMGGDEFVVLFDGKLDGAILAEGRLTRVFEAWKKSNPRRRSLGVTFGMTVKTVEMEADLASLIIEADEQMMRRKDQKRRTLTHHERFV